MVFFSFLCPLCLLLLIQFLFLWYFLFSINMHLVKGGLHSIYYCLLVQNPYSLNIRNYASQDFMVVNKNKGFINSWINACFVNTHNKFFNEFRIVEDLFLLGSELNHTNEVIIYSIFLHFQRNMVFYLFYCQISRP